MSVTQRILAQYTGRNVFVTGHTGFKGAWLIHWLHRIGANVRAYALAAGPGDLYAKTQGDRLCASQVGDVRDAESLLEAVKDFQPDFIFHLAAQSLVGESYARPLDTFDTNVMGTVNLLEAARYVDRPVSVVVVTTDKVYENRETDVAYHESDPLGGHDPYSSSKACAELVTDSYRKSFFAPGDYSRHQCAVATARSGNVIGGGDWNKGHLMPDVVNALVDHVPVSIRNPTATRPWQHVLEPLWGYLVLGARLAESPIEFSGAWNFGSRPGDAITVESLVRRAIDEWGSGDYTIDTDENAPHEARLLRLDSSRAEKLLGWRPTYSVDNAIRITLAWYRDMLLNERQPSALVDRDIQHFEDHVESVADDAKS